MPLPTVSIIGLGRMGSAIAGCLIKAGIALTVWNRSAHKAHAFEANAAVGLNAAGACGASELIVVSLTDYATSFEVLDDVAATTTLAGKTLVQLTSGSPSDARTMQAWCEMHSILFLDAAILAYPQLIGTEHATLFVAGESELFEQHRDLFALLAGNVRFAGENIGAAATLDCAVLEYYYGATLAMLHGAALCDSEGMALHEYFFNVKKAAGLLSATADHARSMIPKEQYAGDECTLATHVAALRHIQRTAHDNQIDTRLPDTIMQAYRKALADGYDSSEIVAIFETLRKH